MESQALPPCVLIAPDPSRSPHLPIFGLCAAERTALAFSRAGVHRFLVVGEPANAHALVSLLRTGPCRHLAVRIPESLEAAVGGDACYVARTDCYYDRQMVARFVEETADLPDTALAVDFRPEAKLRGATLFRAAVWTRERSARVQRVGRELVGADGVMLGLARVTPGWSRAFDLDRDADRAWARFLEREPVQSWSVEERWHAVQSARDLSAARREVLAGAVGVGDGVVAHHLNRPISLRITQRLLAGNVKPWQVSVASFGMTLAAGLCFATGHAMTGGVVAQSASILNGVDDELARVRYQDSPFGGLYDALLDRVGDAAVIGGMTLYAWLMGAGALAVMLGFAAVAGSSLSMLVKEKYGTQYRRPWAADREGRWRWLLLGRDGRLFLTLVAGITGQVELVLAYLAVGTHVHAGARIVQIRAEAST